MPEIGLLDRALYNGIIIIIIIINLFLCAVQSTVSARWFPAGVVALLKAARHKTWGSITP